MTKLSILIPVYNVQDYLRQCLDSVLGQTLEELEIICIDDGSTDSCPEILKQYAARDSRVRILSGPNGGYGKAMNRGLAIATGEYIGIVEPDDYVEKEMFADLYRLAKEQDLDLVKADFYRFRTGKDGGEILTYELLDRQKTAYGTLLCPAEDPSCIRFTMNTWAGIYRRAFLEQHHIRHNETPGASFQDNGFFFQTFVYARRAMLVNKAYYHNRRDNPGSSVKNKGKVYCMNIEYDFIRDLLMEDPALWQRFRGWYWWKKYHNYWFTYNRIDDSYKPEYMERIRREYRRAMELGQLQRELFTPEEWEAILDLIRRKNGLWNRLRSVGWLYAAAAWVPKPVKRVLKRLTRGIGAFFRYQ